MAKLRYQTRAGDDETCSVEDCRIRGRYVFATGQRICYGHLSKWAVDKVVEMGLVADEPQQQYERTSKRKVTKRKYGHE